MKRILVVFLLLFACFSINIIFADVDDIEIEAEVGLEGKIKSGNYIPVEVKLTNSGENIKGKLKLLIQVNNNNGKSYMAVTKDVEIPKGTTKIINTGFYYDANSSALGNSINIQFIVGKKVNEIKETFSKIAESDLIVGMLTDDEKLKSIINKTSAQNGYNRVNSYAVDLTNNFPERIIDIDLYDVIVISEFNKDILSASELKVYNEMLKIKKIINLDDLIDDLTDDLTVEESKYELLEIKLEQEMRSTFISSNNLKYNNGGLWQVYEFIGSVPRDRLPSLGLILFIIISFVILVGPVNFIVLKIMDKTHLTWFTMTGIVVLYVFVIFIVGKTTTLNTKLINEFSVINTKSNLIEKISYLGINGGNDVVKIELETEGYLYPSRNAYSRGMGVGEKGIMYEIVENDITSLEFFNSTAFEFNFATTYESSVYDNSDNFITIKGDTVILNYGNNFDFKIKDAMLLIGDRAKYIGDLKDGNTNIEYSLTKDFSQYQYYDLYQSFDIDDYVKRRYNRLFQEIMNYDKSNSERYSIIGWSDESSVKNIKINNSKAELVSTTLVMMDLDVKYEIDGEIILNKGTKLPTVYNSNANYYYESGIYSIESNGFITFEFDTINDYYTSEMNITINDAYSSNDVTIEIFNGSTNEFELYETEDQFIKNITIDKSNFEKYRTQNNSILIKFNVKENTRFDVPKYSLKGGVK